MTEFKMPEKINLEFLGIPNVRTRYRGDGLLCDLAHPESCLVQVKPIKAKQLFKDEPEQWRIPGDAAKAAQLKKAVKDLPDPVDLESGASVQAIDGVAKILQADGTQIILPAGSRVTVEVRP